MTDRTELEKYLKHRLRDLGFMVLSCREQAEKVLAEYRAGWRGITAFYCEQHRVLLGAMAAYMRRMSAVNSPSTMNFILPIPEQLGHQDKQSKDKIELSQENVTQSQYPDVDKPQETQKRQRKVMRRIRGWKRCVK